MLYSRVPVSPFRLPAVALQTTVLQQVQADQWQGSNPIRGSYPWGCNPPGGASHRTQEQRRSDKQRQSAATVSEASLGSLHRSVILEPELPGGLNYLETSDIKAWEGSEVLWECSVSQGQTLHVSLRLFMRGINISSDLTVIKPSVLHMLQVTTRMDHFPAHRWTKLYVSSRLSQS